MAKNPDTSLPNRHKFIAAITGGGKTQAIKNLTKSSKRAVFWDPDNDHNCRHYKDKTAFLGALKLVMSRGGRIGWNGDDDETRFEWFMMAVWAALDGTKMLDVVVEEAADLGLKQTMPKWSGKVWRRARKYGGILTVGTQRVQEVPKAFITQAGETYIGIQKANDQHYIKRQTGLPPTKMGALEPLNFYKLTGNDAQLVRFKYIG
ncbi:hypothetical protein [Marinomonas atlantica]|uniref:hypothetical protein n=1 Tax=Marinomonas atlantica TaxID=1806668 RepID=UPI0008378A23|nr:hypothetical protein [Marinomonas atlantica]